MGKLTRFSAEVVRTGNASYTFRRVDNGESFSVAIADIHKKVIFPDQLQNENGRLKFGVLIDFVGKCNEKTGHTTYYPDTASYQSKEQRLKDVSSDEYAAHLLNLIDHAHELDFTTGRSIVHAISHHNTSLACHLIRLALFKH